MKHTSSLELPFPRHRHNSPLKDNPQNNIIVAQLPLDRITFADIILPTQSKATIFCKTEHQINNMIRSTLLLVVAAAIYGADAFAPTVGMARVSTQLFVVSSFQFRYE
jgi:hypothetical protein